MLRKKSLRRSKGGGEGIFEGKEMFSVCQELMKEEEVTGVRIKKIG